MPFLKSFVDPWSTGFEATLSIFLHITTFLYMGDDNFDYFWISTFFYETYDDDHHRLFFLLLIFKSGLIEFIVIRVDSLIKNQSYPPKGDEIVTCIGSI